MMNTKINFVNNITSHTLEERLDILLRSKEALCSVEKIQKQIEKKLAQAKTPEDKQLLEEKLAKYKIKIKDFTYSVFLAQRDYDDKLKQQEISNEYLRYMMQRFR